MQISENFKINEINNLEVANCDTVDLCRTFGTPLYVVDETSVRNMCKFFIKNFSMKDIKTEIIYASKAFLNLAMCNIINEEGLALDVVSGGELYTALKANFPADKIYMHGNNKTEEELTLALNSNIGRVIVDNEQELSLLEHLCLVMDKKIDILLRINPGIEAHTHHFIQTSNNDSKFGVSIYSDDIDLILNRIKNSNKINLKGFHCHIGSQIFEENSFYTEIKIMLDFISKAKQIYGFDTKELNLGGGFGVRYTAVDSQIDYGKCLKNMLLLIKTTSKKLNIDIPKVMIEPGRSIIATAGITLYKVGGIKRTYSGKQYIFIDGGMTDNPRTALYDSKYEAVIANKMHLQNEELYTVAGKCCESGDILIKDIKLPKAEKDDILAVFSTGAYNYSMSSNYNKIPRPAVVFVKNGNARLTVKRESYEDLVRNDIVI